MRVQLKAGSVSGIPSEVAAALALMDGQEGLLETFLARLLEVADGYKGVIVFRSVEDGDPSISLQIPKESGEADQWHLCDCQLLLDEEGS